MTSILPGAAVKIKMTCNSGHEESWSTSKNVGKGRWTMPYINLLLILHSFMAGLSFDPLKVCISILVLFCISKSQALFSRCKILFISSSTFYRYLTKLLYPIIWTYWLMDQSRNVASIMVVCLETTTEFKNNLFCRESW